LQRLDAAVPEGSGSGIKPVILPDQCRDTFAVAVAFPWCPGKFWCRFRRLDEDAKGYGVGADRDRGDHRICLRVVIGELDRTS
jgi:hypothetical protein